MLMDMMQLRVTAGSSVFNLEILTSKMHLVLIDRIAGKVDEIMEKMEQDRHISSHDIGKELNIDHKIVLNHLKKAGYRRKLDVWVPHDLTLKNIMN